METQQAQQFTDQINTECVFTNISYLDRLRILVGYPILVVGTIATENKIGNCKGQFVVKAISPFDIKTYKAT